MTWSQLFVNLLANRKAVMQLKLKHEMYDSSPSGYAYHTPAQKLQNILTTLGISDRFIVDYICGKGESWVPLFWYKPWTNAPYSKVPDPPWENLLLYDVYTHTKYSHTPTTNTHNTHNKHSQQFHPHCPQWEGEYNDMPWNTLRLAVLKPPLMQPAPVPLPLPVQMSWW